jgi:ABC-type bacteriocin/lantibiotic exporter with double-glycine peptidase domain
VSRIGSLRRGRWIRAAFLGLWASGCAGFQVDNDPQRDGDVPKTEQRLLSVPFFSDHTDQCGPSAVASVLAFWGLPVDPATLRQEVYSYRLKGSLSIDLLLAAQDRGFTVRLYEGSVEDVKSELRKGHPLVAFVNRGFDFLPIGHYVVINGFDDARQGFYVHTGTARNRFTRYASFQKNWVKTQRTTLLMLPPGHADESPDAGT